MRIENIALLALATLCLSSVAHADKVDRLGPAIYLVDCVEVNGKAVLYQRANGKRFYPIGYNYVQLRPDHSNFQAATSTTEADYDPAEAESVCRLLARHKCNTVRVFLAGRHAQVTPGIAGEPKTKGLYTPYLDNLADFLERAGRHGIYVIFNFCDNNLPNNAYFRDRSAGGLKGNPVILSKDGMEAQMEQVASTLTYIKRKNPALLRTILGVQFSNEMAYHLNCWPFDQEGPVTIANGKTYDMANATQRAACAREGWLHYYRVMHDLVKKIDPQLLTCEGIFVARAVGRDYREGNPYELGASRDKRCPVSIALLASTPLDFIDVHLYITGPFERIAKDVTEAMESSLWSNAVQNHNLLKRKPLILGEFGAFHAHNPDFESAAKRITATRDAACPKYFTGYLAWTLDTFNQPGIYHALADETFAQTLPTVPWAEHSPLLSKPASADHARAVPLKLKDVQPTGPAHGFLIPQRLPSRKTNLLTRALSVSGCCRCSRRYREN